jgi:hypothetical protein
MPCSALALLHAFVVDDGWETNGRAADGVRMRDHFSQKIGEGNRARIVIYSAPDTDY